MWTASMALSMAAEPRLRPRRVPPLRACEAPVPTLHARPEDGRNRQRCEAAPPEPSHERVLGLALHGAKRGRVSTDTASGAPALATTTNAAGSPTAAAPITVSVYTATALAVADPNANALNERNEASDAGHHEAAPADGASAVAARDPATAPAASSAGPDGVIDPGTPAPTSSAIVDLSIVDNHDLAPASALAPAGAASATGAAASESATIDANPASRGDAGCPETPVISRRSHAVAIRAFSIGRTSTPAPAPGATLAALLASATALHGSGASLASPAPAADAKTRNTLDAGSKSTVIVANATSRVHANYPRTPVVSRLPAPLSHVFPGTAVPAVAANAGTFSTLSVGRRSSAGRGARSFTDGRDDSRKRTGACACAVLPPMTATALSPRLQPQSSPSRPSALRTVSRAIQRAMDAIRNALVALFKGDIEPTNESPGSRDEDGCWDEGALLDVVLLGLRKRERRRFL